MKTKITLLLLLAFQLCITAQNNNFIEKFDLLHQTLSVRYAFTEWKGVDWDALYSEFQPRISEAASSNDSSAFYLAVREYVYKIPDGHVSIDSPEYANWNNVKNDLMYNECGGSYGFLLTGLDGERVVVRHITENSSADSAGIKFGAEIFKINDLAIDEALNNTSYLWSETIPATQECRRLQQYRFIGRGKVGSTIKVEFKNRDEITNSEVVLYAKEDNYKTILLSDLSTLHGENELISHKLLSNGLGYIKMTSCGDGNSQYEVYKGFKAAINSFNENSVKGIVLDLRINEGGEDQLASAVAGFFYNDTTFYESITAYNEDTGDFQTISMEMEHINSLTDSVYVNPNYPTGTIYIEPCNIHFDGKVVILNSPRQISSGEGVAMALQKLPNCEVVSFYGSHGSFGIVESQYAVNLDENPYNPLGVIYPLGRSLNLNGDIQLDSYQDLIGGVIPDIRPPLDDAAIDKMYLENIDYELDYAVDYLTSIVDVKDDAVNIIPTEFTLSQNYPNPFNPTTTINYSIPKSNFVNIKIYDVLGNEVAELVNENKDAGKYRINFNAASLSSGVYFYKLQSGNFSQVKKMMLLK